MSLWQNMSEQISQAVGRNYVITERQSVGGGCINQTWRISDGEQDWFVKLNDLKHGDMFEAEAAGLAEMASSQTIRVPVPLCTGSADGHCFLVMEWLPMGGRASLEQLGRQLAAMHRHSAAQFGWYRNNTIGSTPQLNTEAADWVSFWRQQRLGYQLELAEKQGYGSEIQALGDKLMDQFAVLFDTYQPQVSMLHGDLWGGNAAGLADATPVIFDPAFYYGDREAELAMTELFGGFGGVFYRAYNEVWPLDAGYPVRKILYNLYHILNHMNMFGGGYQGQSIAMMQQLLAEL